MVKRYYVDKNDAHEHPEGYLVSHEDYAALQTVAKHYKGEVDKLEAELRVIKKYVRIVDLQAAAFELEQAQESALKHQGSKLWSVDCNYFKFEWLARYGKARCLFTSSDAK